MLRGPIRRSCFRAGGSASRSSRWFRYDSTRGRSAHRLAHNRRLEENGNRPLDGGVDVALRMAQLRVRFRSLGFSSE